MGVMSLQKNFSISQLMLAFYCSIGRVLMGRAFVVSNAIVTISFVRVAQKFFSVDQKTGKGHFPDHLLLCSRNKSR